MKLSENLASSQYFGWNALNSRFGRRRRQKWTYKLEASKNDEQMIALVGLFSCAHVPRCIKNLKNCDIAIMQSKQVLDCEYVQKEQSTRRIRCE
jgi:hypothetical protein